MRWQRSNGARKLRLCLIITIPLFISFFAFEINTASAGLAVAREVSRSNLLKCALFGGDPNWGRVLASVGVVNQNIAPFDPNKVNVMMNGVQVCRGGGVGDDPKGVNLHQSREITIEIDLNAGDQVVELWTNDLSYGYVEVNAEYST